MTAQQRFLAHARRCVLGANLELCAVCRDLDRDASAEAWRRTPTITAQHEARRRV